MAWAIAGLLPIRLALAAPPVKRGVAVLPFEVRRGVETERHFAAFLRDALARALLRDARVPVVGPEASELWQRAFRLNDRRYPSLAELERMGVDAAIHGTVQVVLNLALVRLAVSSARGSLLPGGAVELRFDLGAQAPTEVARTAAEAAFAPLFAGAPPGTPAEPNQWEPLWEYHGLAAPESDDERARPPAERQRALTALAEASPRLAGRAHLAVARMELEAGLGGLQTEDARRAALESALRAATLAQQAEPWNSDVLAVKGEIHYFLKQDYEAKTEASVARLKNPLNGLAYAVLGFVAGLSTGEATEMMLHGLRADPFLWARNRPKGTRPFQNGALEPLFAKWQELRASAASRRASGPTGALAEGIALFDEGAWELAEAKFRDAAEADEYDYLPLLYLNRILVETGRPAEAAEGLARLAAEFPAEADIQFHMGAALEESGAFGRAIDAYERSLIGAPDNTEALFRLGAAALKAEEPDRAATALGKLLDLDPRHEQGWLHLGMANAALERWEAADKAFRAALDLNPRSEEARAWRRRVAPRLAR